MRTAPRRGRGGDRAVPRGSSPGRDGDRSIISGSGDRGGAVRNGSNRASCVPLRSSENAGTLDLNAEIELWTRAGRIKIAVGKHIDVRRLDLLIANAVLRSS